jgi:valyl-tRNA synthetase
MKELPKAYEPKQYEDAMYEEWEKSGYFNPNVCVEHKVTKPEATPFTIVLPPPNVTGTLHMGHAAMLAIEDVLVRYHRMKGDKTLWVPGTDHAAIATQSKVEKIIAEEGKTKYDLGREDFLKRVQKFAQESHDTIVNQAKKMGASLDWSRESYTLDEVRNKAVRQVFKKMYDDGLIYRGHRIVNWDPKLQTTVSDDELDRREEKAPFYYLQYGPFVIGTARPETKFGDKYIVVHPDDERYKQYQDGQALSIEWINGPIVATVIKDKAVDMAFGTGAMTITPWHDTVDFEIAERHHLDKQQVIDYEGKLLPIAQEFSGMPIAKARLKIIEKLQAKGLVVKIDESYVHNVATNSRGGGVIEPQIKLQWFVDVNKKFPPETGMFAGRMVSLKEMMQEVVTKGEIKIIPDRFEKTYFSWINNLRDWCISRQIWFGHQIPVWYKGDEIFCGVEAPQGAGWVQDPDTLDTWFSSGLWTFSTLLDKNMIEGETLEAWVRRSADISTFHPTSLLETGYDIIFFWVARMILMTTYTLGQVPFKTVYLHGLVRDDQGRKMSKSLGNIINPLDMIEKFGTDATRLSLLLGSTPGNDMKLSEEKVAGFRNFTNKLWNISRFILTMNEETKSSDQESKMTLADCWISGKLALVTGEVISNIESYQLSIAGERLRDFTWGDLADWYLEIAKIEGNKTAMLRFILDMLLKLWHPFMPFVTEAVWREMYGGERMLMVEKLHISEELLHTIPAQSTVKDEQNALAHFEMIKNIITGIRSIRAEYKIEPAKKLPATISAGKHAGLLEENKHIIIGLGRLETLVIAEKVEKSVGAVGFVESGIEVFIDFVGAVDTEKEKVRLTKEQTDLDRYTKSLSQKLSNAEFVKNAPEAVVAGERKKLADAEEKLKKITEQLSTLSI